MRPPIRWKCAILVENIVVPFCRQRNAICTPNCPTVQVCGWVRTRPNSKKHTRQLLYYLIPLAPIRVNARLFKFDSFIHLKQEADLYIKQLIKVYGTFNLAKSDTPLHADMLERHLYDTMPKAWLELGKTKIPPPIPKRYGAAAATISRRHSIADSMATTSAPSSQSGSINFRGITMRRISTRSSEVDEGSNSASIRNIINRRQSIQVDMMRGPSTFGMRWLFGFSCFFFEWNKNEAIFRFNF